MRKTNNLNQEKTEHKLFGCYLIEAGLITSNQINEALIEQKSNADMRLGEILVSQGWLKQTTLNYFIKEIIESDKITTQNQRGEIANFDYLSQVEKEENSLIIHPAQLNRKLSLPTFYFSPKKLCQLLLVTIAFLILASSLAQVAAYFLNQSTSSNYSGRLFNLDSEANIPTIYSAITLALCSILLAIISYMRKVVDSRYTNYWKFLSLLFLYISLDEACSIHEIFISPLRAALNTSGFLYFAWVIPAFIFLVIFLLAFLQFIKSLPQKTRSLFIKAGTLYISGVLGMELIGGYYADVYGMNTITYSAITTIEESLEMLGIVVFIYALVSYIKLHIEELKFSICFDSEKDEERADTI